MVVLTLIAAIAHNAGKVLSLANTAHAGKTP
jgi:hypothetical protein